MAEGKGGPETLGHVQIKRPACTYIGCAPRVCLWRIWSCHRESSARPKRKSDQKKKTKKGRKLKRKPNGNGKLGSSLSHISVDVARVGGEHFKDPPCEVARQVATQHLSLKSIAVQPSAIGNARETIAIPIPLGNAT